MISQLFIDQESIGGVSPRVGNPRQRSRIKAAVSAQNLLKYKPPSDRELQPDHNCTENDEQDQTARSVTAEYQIKPIRDAIGKE